MQIDIQYRRASVDDSGAEDNSETDDSLQQDAEWREFVVAADQHGRRLDQALAAWCPEFSRSHLQRLAAAGRVQVDAQVVESASRRLSVGQTIGIELVPAPETQAYQPEAIALHVVYEDEHLMVVDKPAGMVVHPAAGNWSGTLLNALLAHHRAAASLPRAGIVHRLDKDTSGLMVVGKTQEATAELSRAIAARKVHRQYRALCWGTFTESAFSIEAPVGRDPVMRTRMAVLASGRDARTDVMVLASRDNISAVECVLHTGRTHQIRVHLAACGHPLLADSVYGGRAALNLTRQGLHAARLAFVHPILGTPMDCASRMPPDLQAAWVQIAHGN